MAPAAAGMRSRRTTSFTWHGDSCTDVESSADDFSDNEQLQGQRSRWQRAGGYESESRRTFRSSTSFSSHAAGGKVSSYESDSCLTPRSRRTLRRTLSEIPASGELTTTTTTTTTKSSLDTIFSPTHEILHPLQSLRLEQRSRKLITDDHSPIRSYRTSVTFETFRSTPSPGKFDSYEFPRNSVEYESYTFLKPTVEEEDLEQKQSLIASTTVEESDSPAPNVIVIILDAEKKLTFFALDWAIHVVAKPNDEIVLLGVLRHIISPTGYKMVASTSSFYGVDHEFLQLKVNKATEWLERKVSESGRREECEKKKVKLNVRIAPGARARTVVVQELRTLGATYAIFDRKAMRSRRYYGKQLTCQAVRMRRNGRSIKPITPTHHAPTSSEQSSRSPPTFWRRITGFRSSRRITSSLSSPSSTHRSEHLDHSKPTTLTSTTLLS